MWPLLIKNRLKLEEDLRDDNRRFFSATRYSGYRNIVRAIHSYARGKVIDIGCGYMPHKRIMPSTITRYDGFDVEMRDPSVAILGDIQNMGIADETYNTALCFSVLEHIPDPFKATCEIHRILRRDGIVIITVPHISRLHEEPHDYFRYTHYGLRSLLERAGFEVVDITPNAGIFCFLGHQVSTVLLCLVWHIPVVKNIAFWLNRWLLIEALYRLDRIVDKRKVFAIAYTAVARKV